MKRLLAAILLSLTIARDLPATQELSSNDVAQILAQGLTRANAFVKSGVSTNAVLAVVSREGFVLGCLSLQSSNVTVGGTDAALAVIDAITKAGTGAFLSSDQNAFSSRTAGYIVQQHFPPRIANTPTGPLVGVNFSSLAFSDVNFFKDPAGYSTNAYGGGGTNGTPLSANALVAPLTGLNGSPGGLALYIGGQLVGGVGVAIRGKRPIAELEDIQQTTGETYSIDEDVANAAARGFAAPDDIRASGVLIGGIRLPYQNSATHIAKTEPIGAQAGVIVTNYAITNPPPVNYPTMVIAGVEGEVRQPIIDDPETNTIDGQARLTAAEVQQILGSGAYHATQTRAGIRLPLGTTARIFISVVNRPSDAGTKPVILGTFRLPDATVFSWDVAVQKARTALYFSDNTKAFSARAVGFLAESLYPPGIENTAPGPFFGLQEVFSLLQTNVLNPLNGIIIVDAHIPAATQTSFANVPAVPLAAPYPPLANGITIFPGGFPLYRNGVMIGAVGVSGDGVDVDDYVAAWGTVNFEAPDNIRSDQIIYRGARLPYAKFPRNPGGL